MKETQSKILPKRIENNTGGKKTIRTTFQIISTSILIISLGMAVFLPFRKIAVGPALAATVPGVPIDPVTWVKTTDTSQFQTDNNPIDDSIEYWPDPDWFGTDTLTYEICDATDPPDLDDCSQAVVTIEVTELVVTSAPMMEPSLILAPEVDLGVPVAVADDATVVENSWVNIDVLVNDTFGPDGPGVGPIEVVTPPENGTARVNEGPRSPDPTGLAYLDSHPTADYTDKLLISDSEVNEIIPEINDVIPPNEAAFTGVNLFLTDLLGALDSTLTTYDPPDIDFSDEPTGVAYNPTNHHLFFVDDNHNRIFELDPGPDGLYNTINPLTDIKEFKTSMIGSLDPSGVTYDSWHDHLIFVDENGEEVYDIDLGINGILDQSDVVTHFDTTSIGISVPEGVEFNSDNGHLYILSSTWLEDLIAETTIDGKLLRYLDISTIPGLKTPSGLAYIPQADDATVLNTLYIVARGVDNDPPPPPEGSPILLGDPSENDGKLFEVTFPRNADFVDAGPNQTITLPASATLNGTVIDDGWPLTGTLTTTWSAPIGPGLVNFGDASAVVTTASFSTDGEYVLRLTANDGYEDTSDEVTITVEPAVNQAPIVEAGPPQIITLPDSAILNGTVTDDGLPNPPGLVTTDWVKASGPGLVTFGDKFALNTTASFDLPGVYVLRLTAHDSEFSPIDEVTITVNPGAVQNVWLPLILK